MLQLLVAQEFGRLCHGQSGGQAEAGVHGDVAAPLHGGGGVVGAAAANHKPQVNQGSLKDVRFATT